MHGCGLPPENTSVVFTEVAQHKNVPSGPSFNHPHLLLFNIYVLSRLDCVLWGRVDPGKIKTELIPLGTVLGLSPSDPCGDRRQSLWRIHHQGILALSSQIPGKVNFLSTIKGHTLVTRRTCEMSMLEEVFNLEDNKVMPGLMISAKNIDHITIKY